MHSGYSSQPHSYPMQQGYGGQPVMIQQQPQAMVIQQQPGAAGGMRSPIVTDMAVLAQLKGGREWSSGIFDCFNDITSCLLTTFFSECYVCYISGKMGEGCCMPWCVPGALIPMRTKLRERTNIEGSILEDCCCSVWCGPCVLCQLKRELDYLS